jgi:hypothetical protein
MRRKTVFKRGRAVSIVVAGGVAYLIHGWSAVALRNTELTATQAVALRFPQDWDNASAIAAPPAAAPATSSAMVMGSAKFALLSPEPMIPQATVPQAMVQMAMAEQPGSSPLPDATMPLQPKPAAAQVARETRTAAVPAHRRNDINNRPGFMLNDAQIASIKERLHLTADQETMWPAVEAALRNIAYVRAQDAHRRGAPASAAQVASADPDSVEVQGLKSAAIPLLMSFNAEQKDEVRNLAHVMGLDQLASQF